MAQRRSAPESSASKPNPSCLIPAIGGYDRTHGNEVEMLWLILGIILLVIAIAGGAIIHPILFVLGIVAIIMFLMHRRAAY